MKKTYNTPETILVTTIGNVDMMGFTEGSGGGAAEPAPTRKAGTLYI